jgi:hypothetical protein
VLEDAGAEVVEDIDYLVFREGYPPDVHANYADSCSDMTLVAARKQATDIPPLPLSLGPA